MRSDDLLGTISLAPSCDTEQLDSVQLPTPGNTKVRGEEELCILGKLKIGI